MITHHLTYEKYHTLNSTIGMQEIFDKYRCRLYLNVDIREPAGYRLEFDDPHERSMFILTYSEYI